CLWSEYEVVIPSLLNYVFTKTGVHSFFIDKGSEGHENYAVRRQHDIGLTSNEESLSVSAMTVKHRWVMKDVPAFSVENYLFTAENYIDKIDFQLAQTYDGQNYHDVRNSWRKLNEELLHEQQFAAFMSDDQNGWWLDKPIENIIGNDAAQLAQAKSIYYYITNNFTCTNHHRKYIKTTLQDVYKTKKGNVGEINLLLTQMLRRKNIKASPVILSTRALGVNVPSYPIDSKLDYVICRATIEDKVYYLDASHPQLGFGTLPAECYNGHARIIDKQDSASVYFMPDSLREFETTMVNILSPEDGKSEQEGVYEKSTGPIGALEIREAFAGQDEQKIVAEMQKAYGDDIHITGASIDSLKKPEMPVKLRLFFKLKEVENTDIIYFSPVMWSAFKQNPFQAAVRKYPIEMSYPIHQLYVMNMQTPNGYVIDELPKSARVSFNEGEGSFEYLIQKNEDGFQLRTSVYMKKAYFTAGDYNALREFFSFVVKKQNEQIVFKKKK
ncbi:MAG TPA: transglutaminase-like domain-containing protein, partial [Chitinophagaceae bacterium]|nr:transglutaminase-like domain-containing protein [Chitinophagaceae bacterium]